MKIQKRLTPEERFAQQMGEGWRKLFKPAIVQALCNGVNAFDTSIENIHKVIQQFYDPRWITNMNLDDKIFMYVIGLVANRAGMQGFLTEERWLQLGRHLNAALTSDKINNMEGVNFAYRQCYLWDIPAFLEQYKKPGSLTIPDDYKPKPKRMKLAKHR